MTDPEYAQPDLLDLAFPYALDALAEIERRHVDGRVRAADTATAAAFDAVVRGVHETMARVTELDARRPPGHLEAAVLRAIDALGEPGGPVRAEESAAPGTPSPAGAPGLRATIARVLPGARARRAEALSGSGSGRWAQWPARNRPLLVAGVAAAIALAGAGAIALAQRDAPAAVTALRADTVLGQPDVRGHAVALPAGGTVTVTSSARLGAAAVSFAAVPEPPAGHCYQMWLLGPDGAARSIGVMETAPTPGSNVVVRTTPGETLAVTVEPGHGSPHPTTEPLVGIPL